METHDTPGEPGSFTEFFERMFVGTGPGKLVEHPEQAITHHEGRPDETSNLPPVSTVRLISEEHKDLGHIYTIELADPRYFSKPIVFEIVFDYDGKIVGLETE